MDLIHQPIDFVGQNIYDGRMVACGDDGEPYFVPDYIGAPYTTINSPVTPEILYWMPKFLYERYGKPVIITEAVWLMLISFQRMVRSMTAAVLLIWKVICKIFAKRQMKCRLTANFSGRCWITLNGHTAIRAFWPDLCGFPYTKENS